MIKIAAVTAVEYDWSHGTTFTQIVNGCSQPRAKAAGINYVPPGKPVARDARVVAIWTPDRRRSKLIAKNLHIPDVLSEPDEAAGNVDGVICCDDGCEKRPDRNAKWARPRRWRSPVKVHGLSSPTSTKRTATGRWTAYGGAAARRFSR